MAMESEPQSAVQDDQKRTVRVIPEVVAAHFEELASLWAIRQEHLHGPDWTLEDLAEWDARLVAHTDGLVTAGDDAAPVLEEHLASDDPAAVFAAAFILLRMKSCKAAECVLSAISKAQGPQLPALADACSGAPVGAIETRLREMISSESTPQAGVAFLALAAHGRLDPRFVPSEDAFLSDDPRVRQLAWRCMAYATAKA